jgi:hypothetical protein
VWPSADLYLSGFDGVGSASSVRTTPVGLDAIPGDLAVRACATLWLVIRAVRSPWVHAGVLFMLCGLMLNALVTDATAGAMPVVGMPSTLRPASPMWWAPTSKTRLAFLADQAQLGLFSIGDLVMLFGGILILAICLHRTLGIQGRLTCRRLGWSRNMTSHTACLGKAQMS